MSTSARRLEHPHITRTPGIAGGAPVVSGTKFPVRSIVQYVLRQGLTPEELVKEFSQLSLPKIYDALSYYYDHQDEIDREMAENTESFWREAK
jgi:uncharacterized protein (DUF433 family)